MTARKAYLEIDIARESATIICIWQIQRQAEEEESIRVGKHRRLGMPDWRLLALESYR